ncbi:MAG: molybdopterin biosynthesis protein [Armatimonadetes bacterium]|nr:molybdopterin biosynthesis protein [Armatimonadota bacterium]
MAAFTQLEWGVPLEEAWERIFNELDFKKIAHNTKNETIKTFDSLGRVTSSPVVAEQSFPNFYMSSLDGIAVKSADTFSISLGSPKQFKIGEEVIYVDTGRPIPSGYDAVIPISEVIFKSLEIIEINQVINPWQNIYPLGAEVTSQEVIFPQGHLIRALDIGAMLSAGVDLVEVRTKPKVGILALGEDLISSGEKIETGKIFEFNTFIINNLLNEMGCSAKIYPISKELYEDLKEIIKKDINELDILIIIAGKLRGTKLIAKIIQELGELIIYGVNIKPGQSLCLGLVDQVIVLGLPFYLFSAFIGFDLFVKPLIGRMLGAFPPIREKLSVTLAREVNSPFGIEEFLRIKIGKVDKNFIAYPISRGADLIMSLIEADGILQIPANTPFLKEGERVSVGLIVNKEKLENNLLIAGTHDIYLDVLKSVLLKKTNKVHLFSFYLGSQSGLKALKEGKAHLSGIHLFDAQSGEYNIPFLKDLKEPLVLINLFYRYLGLIVPKGNPKTIKDLKDLVRPDIKFINRNINSGTRILLDYYLKKLKIESKDIRGYDEVVYNHMSLAQGIASLNFDLGLGILATAKAFKLDFIPLLPERFDLVIPKRFLEDYRILTLLEIINGVEFKKEIESLGGYILTDLGKIIYEQ